jgi:hypothetical protein
MASDSAGSGPNRPDPAPREARSEPRPSPGGRRAAGGSAREVFRTWRRTRPFWGGLLLLLAGLEMLLIPLTGVLAKGQIKLVIYVGIGGVFGILIGALLIACGLALWYNHAHKTFYSIAGVLLAILSFIGTNLGGFFIGMLLGIVGGSLAFAWTPGDRDPGGFRPGPPRPDEPQSEGIGLVLGEPERDDDTLAYDRPGEDAGPAEGRPGQRDGHTGDDSEPGAGRSARPYLGAPVGPRHRGHSGGHGGGRAIALAAIAALGAGMVLTAPSASADETSPGHGQATQGCILFVICSPNPSPSSSARPAPSGGSGSGGLGTLPVVGGLLPSGSASPGASPSAGGAGKNANKNKKAFGTAGLIVTTSPTVLTASSATMTGLSYQGVVNMPTATGSVQMMKFTMSQQSVTGASQTSTDPGGRTITYKLAAATFSASSGDKVVLYATKLSGTLLGVPIVLTPGNVVSTLLQLLNTLTPAIPVTMTNVTADQPVVLADSLSITGLGVAAG